VCLCLSLRSTTLSAPFGAELGAAATVAGRVDDLEVVAGRSAAPRGRDDVIGLPRVAFDPLEAAEPASSLRCHRGEDSASNFLVGAIVGPLVAMAALPVLPLMPLAVDAPREASSTPFRRHRSASWGRNFSRLAPTAPRLDVPGRTALTLHLTCGSAAACVLNRCVLG
jgi:hypothetical protein